MKCKQIVLIATINFRCSEKDQLFTNLLFVLMYKMTTFKCPAGYIFVLVLFEDPVLIKLITKICYSLKSNKFLLSILLKYYLEK